MTGKKTLFLKTPQLSTSKDWQEGRQIKASFCPGAGYPTGKFSWVKGMHEKMCGNEYLHWLVCSLVSCLLERMWTLKILKLNLLYSVLSSQARSPVVNPKETVSILNVSHSCKSLSDIINKIWKYWVEKRSFTSSLCKLYNIVAHVLRCNYIAWRTQPTWTRNQVPLNKGNQLLLLCPLPPLSINICSFSLSTVIRLWHFFFIIILFQWFILAMVSVLFHKNLYIL